MKSSPPVEQRATNWDETNPLSQEHMVGLEVLSSESDGNLSRHLTSRQQEQEAHGKMPPEARNQG